MPNPTINPSAWAVGATFQVSGSTFAAIDIRLTGIDATTATVMLNVPAGATVHVLKDPTGWNLAGTQLFGSGGWTAGTIAGTPWTVGIAVGATPTDATLSIDDGSGTNGSGILRLLLRNLGGLSLKIEATSPSSVERVLADPSILSLQASPQPVRERAHITLSATLDHTLAVNPAPLLTLSPLPPIVWQWSREPTNPAAVHSWSGSAQSNASFDAPGVYGSLTLSFRLRAAYDLNGLGLGSTANPVLEEVLPVTIQAVKHRMLLVLDRSGSMAVGLGGSAGQSRWNAAVQAAHGWLDLFRAFRQSGGHEVGIITFEHDTGGTSIATSADVSLRDPAGGPDPTTVAPIAGFATSLAQLNLGGPQSWTPIGDALIEAWKRMGDPGYAGADGSVLLVTDGYENSGAITILNSGNVQATFGYQRTQSAQLTGNQMIGSRLFTLAVGQQVDQSRLNQLGGFAFSGGGGNNFYQMTTNLSQILPAFVEMIGAVLDAQQVQPLGITEGSFPLALYFPASAGEQRIAFLVPWNDVTDELHLGWRLQGSTGAFNIVNTDPLTNPNIQYYRRQGHGLLVADIPAIAGVGKATEWRVRHVDGTTPVSMVDSSGNPTMCCIVDLVVLAEVGFDKPQYFIGDAIGLRCRISNGGLPVTGATVEVEAVGPGVGLGTYLAQNSTHYPPPPKVATTPLTTPVPVGPAPPLTGSGAVATTSITGSHAMVSAPSASAAAVAAAAAAVNASPDPPKGKGHMHATLLRLHGMDDLPLLVPPGVTLFDDGAHGDGAANDGDYANVFTNTPNEGTYTFTFRIHGTLPDGSQFSRLFVRSTWVGVRPDPGGSGVKWSVLEAVPRGMAGHVMTFTPRSATGEYLGPFRGDEIDMELFDAEFDGDLVDNLDGSYSRRILYRPGQRPMVTMEIYGQPMAPAGPLPVVDSLSCWALFVATIRCIVRSILRLFGIRP